MSERIDKIKNHFKENKTTFLVGAGGMVIGAAVAVIVVMLKNPQVAPSQEGRINALFNWKSPLLQEQMTIVQIPARGDRGHIVVRDKTGDFYGSINQAAQELNISRSNLSKHLRGLQDLVNNETFTDLGENLSEHIKLSAA